MTPSSCSTLAMVGGPAPRGITMFLVLSSGPAAASSVIAEQQRAAHQGDEQGDEEQDPTEIAEHASASGDQTGPKINEALVPPKPNELLSA